MLAAFYDQLFQLWSWDTQFERALCSSAAVEAGRNSLIIFDDFTFEPFISPSTLFPNALHTLHTYPLPGDLAVRMKCQINLAVDCSTGNRGRGKDKPPPCCVTLWFYCRSRASLMPELVMLLDIQNMNISGVLFAVFRGIKDKIFNPFNEWLG